MIMFWKRKRKSEESAAQRDLDEARRARRVAERGVEVSRERWHVVHDIASAAAEIRRTNHLADDIITILRGR